MTSISRDPSMRIPTLRETLPRPWQFDRSTCFEAGHLIEPNAGWRSMRPIIDGSACTGCLQCYLYCPDGAIYKSHRSDETPVVLDEGFCKGCGICARICKAGAISLVPEER